MKETLTMLTKVICEYLRINENLFFIAKKTPRIIEAKRYFSYIAYYEYNIPSSKISGYLGVCERRSSITIDRAKSIKRNFFYDMSSQTVLDVQAILEILKNK
tara:strand:+ start:298 stop:603 length:306 start_codon:yes stop_codon:yes gene_type:complete